MPLSVDLEGLSIAVTNKLRTLPGYKQRKSEHWCCCPLHTEHTPSFRYNEEMRAWNCKGQCATGGNLVSLAKKLDMDLRPFFKEEPPVISPYHNEAGEVRVKKKRYYKDFEKCFAFTHLEGDKWVDGEGDERYPYNLPQILNAVTNGLPVWIANGEKAADALIEAGQIATCGAHGETIDDWKANRWFRYLRGADEIVIVEQLDDKGKEYAEALAVILRKFVRLVRIVQSKTGKHKHDAFDHLRAGHTVEEFRERVKYQRGFDLISYNGDFKAEAVAFLWEPYFPKSRVILLDADGGTGKSAWMISVAAALSYGFNPLDRSPMSSPVRTLYMIGDTDPPTEYEAVYRANGGQQKYCMWLPRVNYETGQSMSFNDETLRRLEENIIDGGFELVVIDPLMYYLQGIVQGTNQMLEVLEICTKIGAIAARTGCTIIAVRHTSKGFVGKRASEMGLGSVQFRNSFRGQLVMQWHPEQDAFPGVVVISDEKGSLRVPRGKAFGIRRFGDEVRYEANFVNPFGDQRALPQASGRPPKQRRQAQDVLKEFLLTNGKVPGSTAVQHVMSVASCGKSTVYNAATALGVDMTDETWSYDPDPFAEKEESPYWAE